MNDITKLLTATDPEDDNALARMRAALARRAEESELLDVAYRTVDTPVGLLLIAATPRGVVRVAYPREGHDAVLQTLATQVSPRVLAAPARLDDTTRQIDEYFAGRRRRFEVTVDLQLAHGFRRQVLAGLSKLDFAETVSYGDLATSLGVPRG